MSPHDTRRFVIEADGGARGNPGPAAFGAVLRDAVTGEVLARRAGRLGTTTNNVAEYQGLIAGLEAARELDPDALVEARLDSKLVVEQMSGRWAVKNAALRDLVRLARSTFPIDQVTYVWVPRERNKAADALVNAALDGRAFADPSRPDMPDAIVDVNHATVSGGSASASEQSIPGWSADMGTPSLLLLARHGVTDHTVERRFSGRGAAHDPSLTRLGQQQATALASEVLARGSVEVIVTSPLVRARETGAIVAQFLSDAGSPVATNAVVDDLAECGFGSWDGLTFAEVRERDPERLTAWLTDPDVAPPGGECITEVRDRVDDARRDVLTRYAGRRVLVVSHVTPIKLIMLQALEAPLQSLFRLQLDPCSLTTVAWWSDGNCAVRGWAENSHLRGLDAPPGV